MPHMLLVEWHNVEILSIMPADCGNRYPLLPSCWADYYYSPRLIVPMPLVFLYYSALFPRRGSADTRRVLTLTISEFAILAGVKI